MARRAAEMSPPAEDSDTLTVWRRRVSREPAAAASGARSFTLQECHERGGPAGVRLPPRLSPTPERAAPQGGPGGSSMGQMITLKAEDGHSFGAYRAAPAGKPKAGIVVIQEIFGVNSHIKKVTDGFAADGYVALAPAIFDRAERGFESGYAPEDIDRGRAIRGKID